MMSTLPVTSTVSHPPSCQPPEDRHRVLLLYIEALTFIVLLGVLIFILGNWVLPTSRNIYNHFGVLFGMSAVALLGSVHAATRAQRLLVQAFHIFLHIPILVELCRIAYVVLSEGTFSNVLSGDLDALGSMFVFVFGFVLVISVVHGVLYLFHTNMVHGAERSGSGGVFVLDIVCRWICRWISAVQSHRQSQGEADSGSMALESIGKFGAWLSTTINTRHRPRVRASSPDEETITLLGNDAEKLV